MHNDNELAAVRYSFVQHSIDTFCNHPNHPVQKLISKLAVHIVSFPPTFAFQFGFHSKPKLKLVITSKLPENSLPFMAHPICPSLISFSFPFLFLFLVLQNEVPVSCLSLEIVSYSMYMHCKDLWNMVQGVLWLCISTWFSLKTHAKTFFATSKLSRDFTVGNCYPLLTGHTGQLQTHHWVFKSLCKKTLCHLERDFGHVHKRIWVAVVSLWLCAVSSLQQRKGCNINHLMPAYHRICG